MAGRGLLSYLAKFPEKYNNKSFAPFAFEKQPGTDPIVKNKISLVESTRKTFHGMLVDSVLPLVGQSGSFEACPALFTITKNALLGRERMAPPALFNKFSTDPRPK